LSGQLIQALSVLPHEVFRSPERPLRQQILQAALADKYRVADRVSELSVQLRDVPVEGFALSNHDFRGSGGGGGSTSATKSAMVKSVSWPTAETIGYQRRRNRARHLFFIERPQVFKRTAAARQDQDVGRTAGAEERECAHDVFRGAIALHAHWINQDASIGKAPPQNMQDIP